MTNAKWNFAGAFAAGFLGACLAIVGLCRTHEAHAYGAAQPVITSGLTLEDAAGKRLASLDRTMEGGGSAMYFFDGKGRSRLETGTYPDGLPLVVLEGENHTPKAILRMAGANQSGVLVFKDKQNHDRMILGLDMNNSDEEPFLVTFDKNGAKHVVFGRY